MRTPRNSKICKGCHFPNFGKISEMKSISKSRLAVEIYTTCQNLSPEEEENVTFLGNV